MSSKENDHLKYVEEPKYDPTSPTASKPTVHTSHVVITAPTKALLSSTSTFVQSSRTTPSLATAASAVHGLLIQTTNKEEKRILKLQTAAQDLGFELPQHCLKREKWDLSEWIEEQRSGHDGTKK